MNNMKKVHYHLPGLFEYLELYEKFFELYSKRREYFYEWADIASIYGAPEDTLWSGGRTGFGRDDLGSTLNLLEEYKISGRLTFSSSKITEEDLSDMKCNSLCTAFDKTTVPSGIIVYSELLLKYLESKYPGFYFVSSTTKVLDNFDDFKKELAREEFDYVVPDFRLNKDFDNLFKLSQAEKDKCEFLVNECCDVACKVRKKCYENVSLKNKGEDVSDFKCTGKDLKEGYRFSLAKTNPMFISKEDILNIYLPNGFTNFKIEGRGLGSALILEFLLYYLVKPDYQLNVREEIYLDNMLDLF